MKLGFKIKYFRSQRRITLNELSKKTGLTTSFLSQLERDLTSPSVSSLEKIAQALHIKVSDCFLESKKDELIVVRKGVGRRVIDRRNKIFVETLASGVFNINMHAQLFSIGSGSRITKELLSSPGEKFIMVLKGEIKFLNGGKNFLLEEGDSIYCEHIQSPSRVLNIGKKESKIIYISFLPV
ncbi:helix-turn-helix domain-containing protein [Candidatus Omnitrophota bacterium]